MEQYPRVLLFFSIYPFTLFAPFCMTHFPHPERCNLAPDTFQN